MPPAIRLTDIHKWFGPVHANRGAALEVGQGEIHAVVGENGAGKSTLMRILAGLYAPNAGTMEVDGRDVTGWSTRDAIDTGVGMVHQHFMLVPTLSVAENLVLGHEPRRGARLDIAAAERAVRELVDRTGLRVEASRRVSELTVGEAQRAEILKAVYRGAKILILDEPTAVLSPPEVDELWGVLRGMHDRGETIVLITHKLDEVMEISDAITVMRHGKTVARLKTSESSPAAIAKAMVGRDVALADVGLAAPDAEGSSAAVAAGDPLLVVQDLHVKHPARGDAVDGVSFVVNRGEILGIAGVEGNGQTELIEALAGLRAPTSGTIRMGGIDVTGATVRARGDAGLSHIPEDRHHRGLILDYTIADNLVLGQQHRFSPRGVLDRARMDDNARRQIAEYDIRPTDAALPARALSGGNQQKIVIAREMGREFQVLLAAQPTRGVDVGAIEFIHAQLREARAAGKAILLVSADLTEILALSDRIAVMYEGRFAAVMSRAGVTEEVLGPFMTGAAEHAA